MAADLMLSQEQLLLAFVRRLATRRHGRRAAVLRLSKLRAQNRRHHHLQAATSGLRAIAAADEAQLFVLANGDVVFVYLADLCHRVEAEVEDILYLFSDDPALGKDTADAEFVCHLDVDAEFELFHGIVRDLVTDPEHTTEDTSAQPRHAGIDENHRDGGPHRSPMQRPGGALTPELLSKLEGALARADLSSLVRRQSACEVSPTSGISPCFTELYVSIADLRDVLLPKCDFLADRWLFQHLTGTLDRRVLAMLDSPEYARSLDELSLNLNVATVLSPPFNAFDQRLGARYGRPYMVEVQAIDAFSDLRAFRYACRALQERGCRVGLDGVRYGDFHLFDPCALGVDAVKVAWEPGLLVETDATLERLRAHVAASAPVQVVLCRVDTRVAVDLGHSLGISLFQGRCVERLLSEDKRRRHRMRLKRMLIEDT